MGLSPAKGVIQPGADADLTVLDLEARWTVEKAALGTDAGYSIYEGTEMSCRVVHTLSRGRFVLREGDLVDEMIGQGRFVHRRL